MKLAALVVLLAASVAHAEVPSTAPQGPRDRLRLSIPLDLTVTLIGATGWVISESRKADLAPAVCRWCEPNPFDAAVRDALRWSDTATADKLSYITGFALAPVLAIGMDLVVAWHDGRAADVPSDALLVAEATVIALDIDQAVKFAVGRERPFVHALAPEDKGRTAQPSDNNVSFFSGHSTLAFALAVSSATVAWLRGYRWWRWMWLGGMTVAAATAYLRIAADRHYLSDVLLGAGVGSLVGFGVPYLFHRRAGDASGAIPVVAAAPAPGGGVVRLGWVW